MYCVLADILELVSERELVQLTNDSPGATTINEEVVSAFITKAQAEVDGYLGGRYKLPFATVHPIVKDLTARLCKYKLHTRRKGAISEELKNEKENIDKMLTNLSRGIVTLGTQPEPAPNAERVIRVTSGRRVLGRDNLDY